VLLIVSRAAQFITLIQCCPARKSEQIEYSIGSDYYKVSGQYLESSLSSSRSIVRFRRLVHRSETESCIRQQFHETEKLFPYGMESKSHCNVCGPQVNYWQISGWSNWMTVILSKPGIQLNSIVYCCITSNFI